MSGRAIRHATAEDINGILSCVESAFAPYTTVIGQRPAPLDADYRALILDQCVWVPQDTPSAGFAVFYAQGDLMHLETVAVHSDHQGKGIGTLLIEMCEARAKDLMLSGVALYTNAAMIRNLNLYPRLGYGVAERKRVGGFDRVYYIKRW
ncbi:MAG: GNAT family N-acetyltransferase [Pseudomonadota bacterium]